MAFNLEDYEPVADRIERFWKDHPDGKITTELIHHDDKTFIVKAFVCRDPGPLNPVTPDSTGYAEEVIGSTNVNRTSALENCETSAIGRALANLGYAVKNRASREEMVKVQGRERQRSGMQRTPRPPKEPEVWPWQPATPGETQITLTGPPEGQEKPSTAPQTNGNDEQAVSTVNLKRDLLNRLNGDKPRAQMVWRTTLETFGYAPDDEIPADMLRIIGDALSAPNWNPE